MTRRFDTIGNSRPHEFRPGYQNRPRVPGPILPMERPEGEPSLRRGVMLLLFVGAVAWLIVVAWS